VGQAERVDSGRDVCEVKFERGVSLGEKCEGEVENRLGRLSAKFTWCET
jgi:hypothetical protein